jgi:integrase
MRAKGSRIWWRKPRYGADGNISHPGVFLIKDGARSISTQTADRAQAEQHLARHINARWQPVPQNSATAVMVADVLAYYARERAPSHANPRHTSARLASLLQWFGNKRLSEVNSATCRQYAKSRAQTTARRDLEVLNAAIRFFHKEGLCRETPSVALPDPHPPRDRWLTRGEAAKFLHHCWHHRENQAGRIRYTRRHVARFILLGVYTARRSSAITELQFEPSQDHGWIDLERGMLMPASRRKQTKKRQPAIPLPPPLIAHLRRWHRTGARYAVEWSGKRVHRMHVAFYEAARAVGLDDVTPHTLRHTAITWMMQSGLDWWKVAGYAGLTLKTLERVYAHHSPLYLAGVADAFNRHRSATDNREQIVHKLAQKAPKNHRFAQQS